MNHSQPCAGLTIGGENVGFSFGKDVRGNENLEPYRRRICEGLCQTTRIPVLYISKASSKVPAVAKADVASKTAFRSVRQKPDPVVVAVTYFPMFLNLVKASDTTYNTPHHCAPHRRAGGIAGIVSPHVENRLRGCKHERKGKGECRKGPNCGFCRTHQNDVCLSPE